MDSCFKDIREKTSGMSRREKAAYIFTYYWYHMLGAAAVLFLAVLFGAHYARGPETPLFACAAVNQAADDERDRQIAAAFGSWSGLPEERIAIDSSYNFSYQGVRLEGVNESFYDKFFLKWGNSEWDAVIMEESFYKYCRELGGGFRDLDAFDTSSLTLYEDGGRKTAVVLDGWELYQPLRSAGGEKLLLVFPSSGLHEDTCQEFLDFLKEQEWNKGDGTYEDTA